VTPPPCLIPCYPLESLLCLRFASSESSFKTIASLGREARVHAGHTPCSTTPFPLLFIVNDFYRDLPLAAVALPQNPYDFLFSLCHYLAFVGSSLVADLSPFSPPLNLAVMQGFKALVLLPI